MFYNLSEEQILKIKSKFYPQEAKKADFLKSVVVKDYGTDNSLDIVINVKDGLSNDSNGTQIFKIFNNETAKKYLKLKLFEISSQKMFDQIVSTPDSEQIEVLEKIINNYGSLSADINPNNDFAGDKQDVDLHIRNVKYNNSIDLQYKANFLISRQKIDFLSLGLLFYFDKNEYIKDNKIEEKYIDKRILSDKILFYHLYKNNELVSNPLLPVQDLRVINNCFKQSNLFDNLINIINSSNAYSTIQNAIIYTSDNKLDSIDTNNADIIQEVKTNKSISKRKKYFSNIYFSRNSNNNLGLIFNLNYYSLIKENSAYSRLLNKTNLKNEFLNKCSISSIKIVRRRIEKTKNNKIIPKFHSISNVVTSGQTKDSSIINNYEEVTGYIKEIKLNSASKTDTRTFCVTDKNVFFGNRDLYQYGVELVIADSMNYFLSETNKLLETKISNLKQYLEETNKIARPITDKNGAMTLVGSYDPQKRAFTQQFIQSFRSRRADAPSFQQIVSDAVSMFVSTISLLGLVNKKTTFNKQLMQNITYLLHPSYASAENIIYFINIYQKLISQIKRIIKNNVNNSFTVSHWFKNEFLDTKVPIKIGYRFFQPDSFNGIATISNNSLSTRVLKEANKYAINPSADSLSYENKKYCYISPSAVYSKNKVTVLDNLETDANSISDLDFAELEIDVKNTNVFHFDQQFETNEKSNNKTDLQFAKENRLKINASALSNAFSSQVTNLYKEISNNFLINESEKSIINENVDSLYLSLALAKQFDTDKNLYYKSVKNITDVVSKDQLYYKQNENLKNDLSNPKQTEIENRSASTTPKPPPGVPTFAKVLDVSVPIHLNFLLDDTCKLLNKKDNYRKSIKLNSKFQFLFNTIHKIEVLEYINDFYEENWSLLTKEKFTSLNNGYYLCRLNNYKNNEYGIDGLQQIKLPIYDKYFLLEITNNKQETAIIDNIQNYNLQTLNEINTTFDNIYSNELLEYNVEQPLQVALEKPLYPKSFNQPTINEKNIKNPFSRSVTNKQILKGRNKC